MVFPVPVYLFVLCSVSRSLCSSKSPLIVHYASRFVLTVTHCKKKYIFLLIEDVNKTKISGVCLQENTISVFFHFKISCFNSMIIFCEIYWQISLTFFFTNIATESFHYRFEIHLAEYRKKKVFTQLHK